MALSPRVTLLLKNAKSSEIGPQAVEQTFSALPGTKTPLFPFLGSPEAISFEIVSYDQVIYFQVNTPQDHVHYLKGQLIAAYPAITIDTPPDVTHQLTPLFNMPYAFTTLRLAQSQYLPLKTYVDFAETDPLSAVLANLSKLAPGQAAIIQLLVAPVSDGWKRKGYLMAAGSADKEGKVTPHPQKDLIEQKLAMVGHRAAIKIAAFAADTMQANNVLNNIVGSFSAVTHGKSNYFTTWKPLFGKQQLVNSIPLRTFDKTTKQHFTIQELATIFHLPFFDVKDIKNIAWGKTLLGEPPENLPTFTNTPEAERDKINLFGKTEYKNEMQIFGIKENDRRRHMYIIGKSGTGKSTLLGNMIVNDIKHGKGVAVIDPHGDLVEDMLNYIPSNRINDVIYLNPADPEYSVRLNLLENTGIQFTELISSGVISIFKKLYADSWGPRLEYILRNTLLALIEKDQSTMEDIIKMLTNKAFRERTTATLKDPVVRAFWEKEWVAMGERMQGEAIAPILNKIGQFVTSPLIRNVINSPASSFSIEGAMNEGKILLCNLSQGKLGEDNATLMGAMLITKIQLSAMNRVYIPEEQRKDFVLYVDEFQNFATTSFIKILSEARKYRLSLVMANQYVEQIDPDIRYAIFGNCGTLITFLVGAGDAALLSQEFGAQYTPEDLVSIQKHQIVMKLMVDGTQSNPFPAFTLNPASSTNSNKDKVIKVSNERYARKKIIYTDRPDPHMAPTPETSDTPNPKPAAKSNPQQQKPNQPGKQPPANQKPTQAPSQAQVKPKTSDAKKPTPQSKTTGNQPNPQAKPANQPQNAKPANQQQQKPNNQPKPAPEPVSDTASTTTPTQPAPQQAAVTAVEASPIAQTPTEQSQPATNTTDNPKEHLIYTDNTQATAQQTQVVATNQAVQYTPQQWLAYYQQNPQMQEAYKDHFIYIQNLLSQPK